ncbi:MAG: class D sortase [Clostridiales bacterium]|nr:class D sortase [Clostridiales bacterium]
MNTKPKALSVLISVWLGGTVLFSGVFLYRHWSYQKKESTREDQIEEMVSEIVSDGKKTFVVSKDALPVTGEEETEYRDQASGSGSVSGPASESVHGSTSGSASGAASGSASGSAPGSSFGAGPAGNPESSGNSAINGGNVINSGTATNGEATEAEGSAVSESVNSHISGWTEASPTGTASSQATEEYELVSYGTIHIPSIDCELPLWDKAGTIELRYGVGRMPLSAEAGKPGNLVIFGHRMRAYGSIFNRLGEVAIGDTIEILHEGSTFTYTVDQIETIEPSQLSYYIQLENDGEGKACRITLVTCTPTGIGSHRLLVIGHLSS